jgi:hypothetical protein
MDKYTSSLEQLDALILAYRQQLSENPEDMSVQLNLQSLLKLRSRFKQLPEDHKELLREASPPAPEPSPANSTTSEVLDVPVFLRPR